MEKKLTYKKAVEELNVILEEIQNEGIDVDEITLKVKRATELIKFCREKIENTELVVKKIIEDFEKKEKID